MKNNNQNWYLPKEKSGTLTWLSGPYYSNDKRNRLYMKAYFRMEDKSFRKSYIAWSRLPLMHVGAKYESYKPIQFNNNSNVKELVLSKIIDCSIEEGASCIPLSLLSLKEMDNSLCQSACFSFKAKDTTYIIPCFEVVHCLFGRYAFILNKLLHSGGLNTYIESETIDGKSLHINFTEELNSSYVQPSMISELSWILHTKEIYQEWGNIYYEFVKNKRIIAHLPSISGIKLNCSGIETIYKSKKIMLVQSAKLIGRPPTFDIITYTHPNKNQYEDDNTSDNSDNNKFLSTSTEDDFDDFEYATDGNGRIIEQSIPHNTFSKIPIVKNISKKANTLTKPKFITASKKKSLTTNEYAVSGSARSVEFDSYDNIDIPLNTPEGFEKFVSAVNYFWRYPYKLSPQIIFNDFEGDTSICFMKNGQRRNWALVTIPYKQKMISIIEANVEDGLTLSTLIILSERDASASINNYIKKLIEDKSWRKEWLNSTLTVHIDTLKHHVNRSPEHWAELIINTASNLMF